MSQIEEMEEAREKQGNKGELDDMIDVLRKEKDHLEIQSASLQEQLSKRLCEVTKLKEQLLHAQEECRVRLIRRKLSPFHTHLRTSGFTYSSFW